MTAREIIKQLRAYELVARGKAKTNRLVEKRAEARGRAAAYRNAAELVNLLRTEATK